MTDEGQGRSVRDAPGKSPTIFVTDAAIESTRIADTLRRVGYYVVEVPLPLLVTRAQAQRPNVVLVDVDAPPALAELGRLRRLPGAAGIDFVYFATGAGPIKTLEDAISNEGSAFFVRPVDVDTLVRRIESLTGGARREGGGRDGSSGQLLPGPGLRTPGPPLPMSVPSLADIVEPPRSLSSFGTLSNELQQLLAEAEQRAEDESQPDMVAVPSPEEEIEAVLPGDVLASLDEPLEGDEDEDNDRFGTGPGLDAIQKPTTAGGKLTTASGRTPHTHERRIDWSDTPPPAWRPEAARPDVSPEALGPEVRPGARRPSAPPPRDASRVPAEKPTRHDVGIAIAEAQSASIELERADSVTVAVNGRSLPSRPAPALSSTAPSGRPTLAIADVPSAVPSAPAAIVIQRASDARGFLAQAIARRSSGALCFEHEHVVRRLVVREGDLVTAASGAERETLVHFLGARGELPRDEVERLANKIPPYGRHAGAALVAHGWLSQDQLWAMLRAHAEWIATAILRLSAGTAELELDPPGRLRSEPSVFGASTGAELFVELVRRAVSPEEAIAALGGDGARIGPGPAESLLSECAIPVAESELLLRAKGGTVGELLARLPDAELATVLHAVVLLGILEVTPAAASRSRSSEVELDEVAALDDEAIRARVRARLELVDEGDYFSLLGIARDATSYEVRRAFIELRRTFEPTRILSPRLVDLSDDVRKIVIVLEEAYEILRDSSRRERYRRAIETRPS